MTIVNKDSRVINNLEASLTDDAIVIIYDRHMFIVQASCIVVLKGLVVRYKNKTFLSSTSFFEFWSFLVEPFCSFLSLLTKYI